VIHGQNDVRVARQDSDDVVAGLKARGAPVDYLLLENEGHTVREWRNQLLVWRKTESFLASCLGGRTGGPDPIETGSTPGAGG
jgi:dipeptidyl aminopeptidase/acylaminoacyl peptidase